ncbi:uncharacterized protein LOC118408481 [Branchiostoma floridae]|uniref:Uncharacterized protein LOC118408481 n=1 Tax=Branchiostoma floridae TaxID=7739 RepID=A0A9J7HVY0_BRAFL|nr:uncharacterized protein LOC118408481 [Branchiostoma floridae]
MGGSKIQTKVLEKSRKVEEEASLLEEKKGGTLSVEKEDPEAHLRETYSDPERSKPLSSPGYVPRPPEPSIPMDISQPKWSELSAAVRRARAAAAPGPNGVPYRVYKMCPKTLYLLWKLMRVAWRKQCIPVSWRRAGEVKGMINNYFADFKLSISTRNFTTEWQRLEKGIAMGCSISPLLFTMGFEILLIGAKQVVGGVRAPSGEKMPPLRAFMDDVTSILRTAPCTNRVLLRLEELTAWAGMQFKPSKSRSLSLRKGKLSGRTFSVNGQHIPTIQEESVKSLGRLYTSNLNDKGRGQEVLEQACNGLQQIDKSELPGRLKMWCVQFMLFPRLKWPLKMYNISVSTVDQIDRKANAYFRRWLGVPRCLSSVALYGKNKLNLPFSSIAEDFKLEKVRLVLELEGSQDPSVRAANQGLSTGKKWSASTSISQAISRQQHKDLVGSVQVGRAGFGWGKRDQRKVGLHYLGK